LDLLQRAVKRARSLQLPVQPARRQVRSLQPAVQPVRAGLRRVCT
jgi:hypothetical protein